jgi:hypothetical protein
MLNEPQNSDPFRRGALLKISGSGSQPVMGVIIHKAAHLNGAICNGQGANARANLRKPSVHCKTLEFLFPCRSVLGMVVFADPIK